MNEEQRAYLQGWRATGTDIQKRHASWRLSLPDVPDPLPEPDHIRAARLIAEHPPDPTDRRCCNG